MRQLVPHFIAERFKSGETKGRFHAVALFADMSGFTHMTEVLMQRGKENAELLAVLLRSLFDPLVKSVYAHDGFITGFAGDSFQAIFLGDDLDTCYRAVQAARRIQRAVETRPPLEIPQGVFKISIKVGVGEGETDWGILGGNDEPAQYVYYFKGEAIEACTEAEHLAQRGQIILAKSIYTRLKKVLEVEEINSNFYRLLDVQSHTPEPQAIQIPAVEDKIISLFAPPGLSQLSADGEFRNVITVFLGVRDALGETELTEFISLTFRLLRQFGGSLAKLDFGDKGCNLLLFWGAPLSYENSGERALNFILALKESTTAVIRAGITYRLMYAGFAGSNLRSDYTCCGRGINLAARLMMKADWNAFWLDNETQRLAGARYDIKSVGEFQFKGFQEPLPAFSLLGRLHADFSGIFRREQIGLVGRSRELTQLHEFIHPILTGHFAGICMISGEAGIGKSRLIDEFTAICRQTSGPKITWLHCPADEILRQTLNPFRYLLRDYFQQNRQLDESERKRRFERILGDLIQQTPDAQIRKELERTRFLLAALVELYWPDSLYHQLEPRLRFENTLVALENLIKAESLRQPLILELEDAHWLDNHSLLLVQHLVDALSGYPVAILAVCRIEGETLPAIQSLATLYIELKALGRENVRELAHVILMSRGYNATDRVADELVSLLLDRTDGNPFFVEQMLHYLVEEGLIQKGKNGLTPIVKSLMIPTDVRTVLIARLDRLTSAVKNLVQTAAILGQEFEISVLLDMIGEPHDIGDMLKVAERRSIWQSLSEARYVFRHALMRDTVYDMQLKSQRRTLHEVAAQAYERLFQRVITSYLNELAYHYEMAENYAKAIFYLEKAGDHSREKYHNDLALTHYNKLLNILSALLDDNLANENPLIAEHRRQFDERWLNEKNFDTLLKKGQILEIIGEWNHAEQIYKKLLIPASLLNDRARIARVYRRLGWALYLRSQNERAMEYFKIALKINQEIGDLREVTTITGKIGNLYYLRGEYDAAVQYFQQDLELCEQRQDKQGISIAMGNIGNIYRRTGQLEQAMACYQIKLNLIEEIGDKKGICVAIGNMGSVYFELGNFDQARKCYERYMQISEELGDKLLFSIALEKVGNIYLMKGDYERAETIYERKLLLSRTLGDKKGILRAYARISEVFARLGKFEEALTYCDQAIEISRELQIKDDLSRNLVDKATLQFRLGRYAAAAELNKEAQKMAHSVKNTEALFNSSVLAAKLKLIKSRKKQISTSRPYLALLALIEQAASLLDKAELHYDLWQLTHSDDHRQAALLLFKEMNEKTPGAYFSERIRHLSAS